MRKFLKDNGAIYRADIGYIHPLQEKSYRMTSWRLPDGSMWLLRMYEDRTWEIYK